MLEASWTIELAQSTISEHTSQLLRYICIAKRTSKEGNGMIQYLLKQYQ